MTTVIVCTGGGGRLAETLATLQMQRLPEGMEAEIVLVDNSADGISNPMSVSAGEPAIPIRLIREPKRGLSNARNAGTRAAQGDYLLWTDDDVEVPSTWLCDMVAPLVGGSAEIVSGAIHLPPCRKRPWMERFHHVSVSSTEGGENKSPFYGASMGYTRTVLQKVPWYDPELGAGAIGFGEETLFYTQLKAAGFRHVFVPTAPAMHYYFEGRLKREVILKNERLKGLCGAYMFHHWEYRGMRLPKPVKLALVRLKTWRAERRDPFRGQEEGCSVELMLLTYIRAFSEHAYALAKTPRHYDFGDPVKKRGVLP